uniref:Uncharacterized protein n=1 Tax=Cannabis sativa TaxID=3483 RepID=A0A803NI86_CANSA
MPLNPNGPIVDNTLDSATMTSATITTTRPFIHSTPIATYPPTSPSINLTPTNSPSSASIPVTAATSLSAKAKGKSIMVEDDLSGEGSPQRIFKRQVESDNLRSVLKRCRNNTQPQTHSEGSPTQSVSSPLQDSSELNSSFPAGVVGKQPRQQP